MQNDPRERAIQPSSRPKMKSGTDQSPRLLRINDTGTPDCIPYELIRARRRSMVIQARAEGIRVRAPKTATVSEIEAFMRLHATWIRDHLAACTQVMPFAWQEGTVLPVLGSTVRIAGVPDVARVERIGDQLAMPPQLLEYRCREAVLNWLRTSALILFIQRVLLQTTKMGIATPPVRLSNARTRWGSCAKGPNGARLSLHWKLYLLPLGLIDYVIAHELAHLREMNHSARFWAEVAKLYPDYKAARLELVRAARTLPPI
jgi:predicted metal-dependent hydrolase